MFPSRSSLLLASLCLCFLSLGIHSESFAQFSWPEEPENVTVLPDSITGERLGAVMRSWTSALGVRCSHCHVGQGPLSEYDFASDDKPAKEKTRIMMRMTQAINSEYVAEFASLEETPEQRVRVTCLTCHRNVAKPELLESVLFTTFEENGVEEVITHYDELREAYYGGFSYDFREGVLTRLGDQLKEAGQLEAGLAVLEKEINLHSEFPDVYRVQGAIYEEMGNKEEAIASYEKGKSLSSTRGGEMFQRMIDRLNNQ